MDTSLMWFFGAFVFIFVGGDIADHMKRRLANQTIRRALDQGQQLDPAIKDWLLEREDSSPPLTPLGLRVGGIVVIASGIGIALSTPLLIQVWPKLLYPALGLAVMAVCIGVGLLIASRTVESSRLQQHLHGST
jgi:hypothetical protein